MADDRCDVVFRERYAEVAPDIEVHIQRDRPGMFNDPDFPPFVMTCPHGVRWRLEPTNDQRIRWAEDGTR